MITKKTELVDALKKQLQTKSDRAIHAMMVLYDKQTSDEQTNKHTIHENGVGFNAYDSEFLTNLAQQYKLKGFLSCNQKKVLMKIIPKYAAQLINISIQKGLIRKEKGCYVW